MNNLQKTIKVFLLKNEMTSEELDCLLSELISCYIEPRKSDIMELLLEDKFIEFKALCKHMIETGSKIKTIKL